MARILIVNADDSGLSRGQNYGILEAFRHGVVTSTTAMVNGEAVEHAAALYQQEPLLAVGMHFVLTHGAPLTPMPSLAPDGKLGKAIWQRSKEGSLPLEEIARELASQYQRFTDLFGHEPTHIDSHHHVHMIEAILPIVADFAAQRGVGLRLDRRTQSVSLNLPARLRSSQHFSDEFYDDALSEARFLQILDALSEQGGTSLEIMCHPAFIDNTLRQSSYCFPRLTELEVLTSPTLKYGIAERGYQLGSFLDL